MKSQPRLFPILKFTLVALSLLSLTQTVTMELDLRHRYSLGLTGTHVLPGLYYEDIFFSSLLVFSSFLLLTKKLWARAAAAVLGGFVFYITLPRDFWYLADAAEVERFSPQHFSLWWPNLSGAELVQIISSGLILTFSAASSVSALARRRRAKTLYP